MLISEYSSSTGPRVGGEGGREADTGVVAPEAEAEEPLMRGTGRVGNGSLRK